jgi:hypothetical protein
MICVHRALVDAIILLGPYDVQSPRLAYDVPIGNHTSALCSCEVDIDNFSCCSIIALSLFMYYICLLHSNLALFQKYFCQDGVSDRYRYRRLSVSHMISLPPQNSVCLSTLPSVFPDVIPFGNSPHLHVLSYL